MDFNKVKELGELPDEKLTALLVDLYRVVAGYHDQNIGISPFDWHNLEMSEYGFLRVGHIAETKLTDDVLSRNLHDYAAIIYCVAAQQKNYESMATDAGAKIRQPVLREIVLTLCGRNYSIDPLLEKLRMLYVNEDTFFSGYTTVDEKESYETAEKARNEGRCRNKSSEIFTIRLPDDPWYKKIGTRWWILIGTLIVCLFIIIFTSNDTHDKPEPSMTATSTIPGADYVTRPLIIASTEESMHRSSHKKIESIFNAHPQHLKHLLKHSAHMAPIKIDIKERVDSINKAYQLHSKQIRKYSELSGLTNSHLRLFDSIRDSIGNMNESQNHPMIHSEKYDNTDSILSSQE